MLYTAVSRNVRFLHFHTWWYYRKVSKNGFQYGFHTSFNARRHKMNKYFSKNITLLVTKICIKCQLLKNVHFAEPLLIGHKKVVNKILIFSKIAYRATESALYIHQKYHFSTCFPIWVSSTFWKISGCAPLPPRTNSKI